MKFEIGCSGYSYPDWKGVFYPPALRQADRLAYYARCFDTVEINYTYYRMPAAETLGQMASKTPDDFSFWIKAFGDITHKQDRAAVEPFREALAPLRAAGKLGGVLLQFPQSFHNTGVNRRYLDRLADDFEEYGAAVEFRHHSWAVDAVDEAFRKRNLSLVIVDAPRIEALYPFRPVATNPVAYLRLHSRNAGNWYNGEARYDYRYTDAQLAELIETLRSLSETVQRLVVFFNNCKRGQAAQNAQRLKELLGLIGPSQVETESAAKPSVTPTPRKEATLFEGLE